jgi:4-hydroxybenzoate polyprenyltransferase
MEMERTQRQKGLLHYLSWRGWGLIRYNATWQNVWLLFYLGLIGRPLNLGYIRDVGLFLAFSLTGTAYGYLVNDLADRELDRRAGKPNAFHQSSRGQIVAVMTGIVLLMTLLGIPFARHPGFILLWGAWILATTVYSLPPLRLKERGVWGLATTIIAQQTLPAAMALAALGAPLWWSALLLLLYITLRGICSDVGHQMRDRARDRSAGARTFAVIRGPRAIARLYGLSLELEALVFGAVLVALAMTLPRMNITDRRLSPLWPLLVLYLPLLVVTFGRAWRRLDRGDRVDPYDEAPEGPPRDLLHFLHQTFPTVLLPLYLSLWLTWDYWPTVVFVMGLLILYQVYDPRRWRKAWSALTRSKTL